MVLQAEHTEQPDMHGTFLLLHLLTRVAFELDASYSFINASCVTYFDLEVEAFREAMCGCSSLGCRVRVDVTPRPKRVYSTCNCRGVYENQVSHCGILEMKL